MKWPISSQAFTATHPVPGLGVVGLLGLEDGGHLRWTWHLCFLVGVVQTACSQYLKWSVSVALTNRTVSSISRQGSGPVSSVQGRSCTLASSRPQRPGQFLKEHLSARRALVQLSMWPRSRIQWRWRVGAPSRRLPGAERDCGDSVAHQACG